MLGEMNKIICGLILGVTLAASAQDVRQILETSGVKGGLIVHIGRGELRANDSFIVDNLNECRGGRLPYADNLVNLLIAESSENVPADEVMRVLVPNGVAFIGGKKIVKPRPADTDEWTHFLHDATGNSVSHDLEVGPPRRVQWIESPKSVRSHEHTPTVASVVSSAGRIFYIVDEAPTDSILNTPQWHVVARDAYNGILLWKRSLSEWWPHICGWTSGPRQLQRRLVAVGDRVFVALGLHAPLSILDAATGKTIRVCEQTAGAEEIVWHNGTLLLAIRKVTDERVSQLAKWSQLSKQPKSPLYDRDTAAPLLKVFRNTEENAETTIMAVDAASGRELWKKTSDLKSLTLSAIGNKAFYQTGEDVVCVELATGRNLWETTAAGMRMVCERGVVCADGGTVTVLSLETGKALWSQDSLLLDIKDAFAINGSLWLGGFKAWQGKKEGKRGPAWGPYFVTQCDLATGKRLKHIEPENPGHHHRCYLNKATDRYILGGRRGTEFIDLQTGEVLWNSWARGVCMYGIMPANGLFYMPPHACGCYVATKLNGFYALASKTTDAPSSEPLERGPAFALTTHHSPLTNSDWPTFRHDAERSGTTSVAVPSRLKQLWQSEVGGKLTAPTIAGGKVFVASTDAHRVCALDAESGAPKWSFTTGGRVDSPPTLCGEAAIFGSRDGSVYSVRASDGVLVWRLRVARDDRRIVAYGQLESALPVNGSVLIADGVAFVTAGRSSYLDGGIDLCRVELATGKLLSRTPIYSPDPKTGKQPPHEGPGNMPGVLNDILSSDKQFVYLRESVFDKNGRSQAEGKPHLLTLTGFLDDTWAHRSDWIFGTKCALPTGCTRREKDVIFGRLLVFNDATIFGYGRQTVQWSNQLQDGPYRVFAANRADGEQQWSQPVPIQVRAMLLAGKTIFVAGKSLLLAISATDGAELARYPLDAAPAFDGLAAANGRLYLSMLNGQVVCLGEE
jgi:outer membrane protein assembly factor BamB